MKKVDSLSTDILNLKIPNNAGMIDTAVVTLSREIQIIATELTKLKQHQMSDSEGIVICKLSIVYFDFIFYVLFWMYLVLIRCSCPLVIFTFTGFCSISSSPSISLFLPQCLSLSLCTYICTYIWLSLYLSISHPLSLHLSLHLSLSLSISLFIYTSLLSLHVCVCVYCPSFYLFVPNVPFSRFAVYRCLQDYGII